MSGKHGFPIVFHLAADPLFPVKTSVKIYTTKAASRFVKELPPLDGRIEIAITMVAFDRLGLTQVSNSSWYEDICEKARAKGLGLLPTALSHRALLKFANECEGSAVAAHRHKDGAVLKLVRVDNKPTLTLCDISPSGQRAHLRMAGLFIHPKSVVAMTTV